MDWVYAWGVLGLEVVPPEVLGQVVSRPGNDQLQFAPDKGCRLAVKDRLCSGTQPAVLHLHNAYGHRHY